MAFLTALLALVPAETFACSCAPVLRSGQVPATTAIFIGEVVSVTEPPAGATGPGGGRVSYRFRVERSLKGNLPETVDVTTAASSAACGVRFAPKERHLVFAHRPSASGKEGLETTLCDFNVSGAEVEPTAAEVQKILGE
jgi:hypothetical protein